MENTIDLSFLKNFTGDNPEKMKKYINMFLTIAPQSLGKIEAAMAAQDWDGVRAVAHALKPQITYMGIKKGEDLVRKIEEHSKEKTELDKMPDLFTNFKSVTEQAMDELKTTISAL